jgi:alpha-amylase/alpha-mannosidase (GH57 family)
MADQAWNRHYHLYQPYAVGTAEQPLTMVFRDRDISDAFGFVYHKTTPESAADDVLRRIRGLAYDIPLENGLLAVILDGENPWEHYHDGGERFLSLLFRAFEQDGLPYRPRHPRAIEHREQGPGGRAAASTPRAVTFRILDQPGL